MVEYLLNEISQVLDRGSNGNANDLLKARLSAILNGHSAHDHVRRGQVGEKSMNLPGGVIPGAHRSSCASASWREARLTATSVKALRGVRDHLRRHGTDVELRQTTEPNSLYLSWRVRPAV
jgi:hypothetical protein